MAYNQVDYIKTVSYSRWSVFSECPYRAQLAFVKRIKEPAKKPLPDGQEYPNDRGTRIHQDAEKFISGHGPFVNELKHFKAEFDALAEVYAKDREKSEIQLEQMWTYDIDWKPCPNDDWNQIWLIVKIDLFVLTPDGALAVDFKSGKKYGNEVKHGLQMELYALACFLRYPKLQKVTVENWYIDQDELVRTVYDRDTCLQGGTFSKWNNKLLDVYEADDFPAKPSVQSCRFCQFRTGAPDNHGNEGTGHCKLNVQFDENSGTRRKGCRTKEVA